MANELHTESHINIDEELSIMLEKQMQEKKVIIGEEKGTSVFYSDTVTSSIRKEMVAKTSAIKYSAEKYNEKVALKNFGKGLIVDIK